VKDFRRRLRERSYDKFLVSKSPVTGLQFLGLLIIGGSLIAVSLITLAVMLREVRPSQLLDMPGSLIVIVPVAIFLAIAYLGVMHIRRAISGRRRLRP
jgi:hypothetical protein